MNMPQIVAHRGASYLAPENTLSAFRKAIEIGADAVEMDVQPTKDGELVIHHDYIIDLHTEISGKIYDMVYEDLKELDFGKWKDAIYEGETIATLHQALELCKNLYEGDIYLEMKAPVIKDADFLPRVLEEIQQLELVDRIILVAFNHELLRQAKEVLPQLRVGILTFGQVESTVLPTWIWGALGLENGLEGVEGMPLASIEDENCRWVTRWVDDKVNMLWANFPGENMKEVLGNVLEQRDPVEYVKTLPFTPEYVCCKYQTAYPYPSMVKKLHEMGMKVGFWTVDTEEAVRDLLKLEPDIIISNRPDRVREWADKMLAEQQPEVQSAEVAEQSEE